MRLLAPQFVKAYVKSPKNDARDAEAICEAVTRPTMRFVPIEIMLPGDSRIYPGGERESAEGCSLFLGIRLLRVL